MSGEQAPIPPWRGRNPGMPNNNVEREPNGFLPTRGAAAGSTELRFQIVSDAYPYGRPHQSKFDHALPPIGSRRRRTPGRVPQPDRVVGRLPTDLCFVVCSMRSRRAGFWLSGTAHTQRDPWLVLLGAQLSRWVKRRLPVCLRLFA